MSDTVKFLIIHSDSSLPDGLDIKMQDLREVILSNPDVLLSALKDAVSSEGPAPTSNAVGGDLPSDTPIFKMLTPETAALLSPAAQRLTKSDLQALATKMKTADDFGLTLTDLQTIQDAFHLSISTEIHGLMATRGSTTIKCCCCPCCCCTAATVVQPMRKVA